MTPELIGVIFTGLTTLMTGVAANTAQRNRRIGEDRRALRAQVRDVEKQRLAAVQHIVNLELQLAWHQLPVPPRPAILEESEDDDADEAVAEPVTAGRRHRKA